MAKVELFPGEFFPSGFGFSARNSRNGVVLSFDSYNSDKGKPFPVVASELQAAKDCLIAARNLWDSWSFSMQTNWATLARLYFTPRFPAVSGICSDFNLFLSQYSAYFFGNYYFNGYASYFDGIAWQQFYHNNFVEPEYNRIYEPNPAIIGNYSYISSNFTIQDAPLLDITNETLFFRLNYIYPPGTPTFFWNFILFFNWSNSQSGFLFYISNPGIDAGLSFAKDNRLLIAAFKPTSTSSTGASLYPANFIDIKTPLAKYYNLSILNLQVGMKVKITAFSISSYGQPLKLGEFYSTLV